MWSRDPFWSRFFCASFTSWWPMHHLHQFPTLQSGFRTGHSTGNAVLQVKSHWLHLQDSVSSALRAFDYGDLGALIFLNLTTAFDTVDHHIMLQSLSASTATWFRSSFIDRTQSVCRGTINRLSPFCCMVCHTDRSGAATIHFVHIDLIHWLKNMEFVCWYSGTRWLGG